jgi:hypothetical protein
MSEASPLSFLEERFNVRQLRLRVLSLQGSVGAKCL